MENKSKQLQASDIRPYNHIFLFWAIIAVFLIRLFTLGMYPLMDKTEARYAEIAREMVATNNWITPQLDPGVPFWGKPPLSFWLTAISFKIFGINEWAARLPSLILSIWTVYFVYLLGTKLRGQTFGLLSAIILSTTGIFWASAGSVMTDPSLVFAMTLSMISFAMVFLVESKADKMRWGYLFFIALGVSFITKGPIGWVLTWLPLTVWCIYHKQWNQLKQYLPWKKGICLTFMIAIPWYILAEQATPGFLKYFFIGEHFQRFIHKGWSGDLYGSAHAQPKGMIWVLMIPATMPWVILLAGMFTGWFKNFDHRLLKLKNNLWLSYLLLWCLSPLVFFTLAGNILITYLLPSLPAFAILMAIALSPFNNKLVVRPWFFSFKTFKYAALATPLVGLMAALTFLPVLGRKNSQWDLVKIFETQRTDKTGSLFYIQGMPPSADFYANGDAVLIQDEYQQKVENVLANHHDDFFVIQECDLNKFSPKILAYIYPIDKFNKNILYRELEK